MDRSRSAAVHKIRTHSPQIEAGSSGEVQIVRVCRYESKALTRSCADAWRAEFTPEEALMSSTLLRRPEARLRGFHDEGHGFDMFGLHPPTLRRTLALGGRLCDRYFRTRSYGVEHIPREGPAILVANHGGALPIDAALVVLDVDRAAGRIVRPIADRFVTSLPLISTWFARTGAVVGTHTNVARLLARGELIAIWPEGSAGIAKSARDRYQMRTWQVGHAELAIRYRAPIVPIAILGAEEAWPVLGRTSMSAGSTPAAS